MVQKKNKVIIVGLGYVGLATALVLSQNNEVVGLDINQEKIFNLKSGSIPFHDNYMNSFIKDNDLTIKFDLYNKKYLSSADYIIIATPTNYDDEMGNFDTRSVEQCLEDAVSVSQSIIIIKSTIPLGFTLKQTLKLNYENIYFCPEFLREGNALSDNLYPDRIVIGFDGEHNHSVIDLLSSATRNMPRIILSSSVESEAAKLFSNTFLAMRVAFFNELDSYALSKNLNSKTIIDIVCADKRIGNYYNNPSFGYGGYCLPKDTKQLLNTFNEVPQNLIKAIVHSNQTRKIFISNYIIKKNIKKIGIYRLTMKTNSDNFRESCIFDVIEILLKNNIAIEVYEPLFNESPLNFKLNNDLDKFIQTNDLIIANRFNEELKPYIEKIFTRDIFQKD